MKYISIFLLFIIIVTHLSCQKEVEYDYLFDEEKSCLQVETFNFQNEAGILECNGGSCWLSVFIEKNLETSFYLVPVCNPYLPNFYSSNRKGFGWVVVSGSFYNDNPTSYIKKAFIQKLAFIDDDPRKDPRNSANLENLWYDIIYSNKLRTSPLPAPMVIRSQEDLERLENDFSIKVKSDIDFNKQSILAAITYDLGCRAYAKRVYLETNKSRKLVIIPYDFGLCRRFSLFYHLFIVKKIPANTAINFDIKPTTTIPY